MVETWQEWETRVIDRKFQLLRWLGGSDTGGVFLAEYRDEKRQRVSIKLIPAYLSNGLPFRWEQAAKLSHAHLIPLLQTGCAELDDVRLLYVAMQYAEENLGQILPQRPLTEEETTEVLRAVLGALGYLHGRGLVHGHIKPTNIMAVGNVVKLSSDRIGTTGCSQDVSWPCSVYHAPETANGILTPAFDLWGLGITLVAMLTQHPPLWEGPGCGAPLVPDTVPQPFRDIAQRCLQPDPRSRGNVADIVAHLQQPAMALPAPTKLKPLGTQASFRKERCAAIAGILTLTMTLGWPKLREHYRQVQPATAAQPKQPQLLTAAATVKHAPALLTATRPVASQLKTSRAAALAPAALPPSKLAQMAASPVSPPSPVAAISTGASADSQLIEKALPEVPQKALNTIQGTLRVSVRVSVDRAGGVVDAILDTAGPSKYFAALAVQAARNCKFRPVADGPDTRDWILQFDFRSDGLTVAAVPSTTLKATSGRPSTG
jgi:hypothetical protein